MSTAVETSDRGKELANWETARKQLKSTKGDDAFNNWLATLQFKEIKKESGKDGEDTVVYLTSPSRFMRNWVTEHYTTDLVSHWKELMPEVTKVKIVVRTAVLGTKIPEPQVTPTAKTPTARSGIANHRVNGALRSETNEDMTLENFVSFSENVLAFEAAKLIAGDTKEVRYNPLYVYGRTDVGKTHIIQAIVHARESAGDVVSYISGQRIETFLANKIKNLSAVEFKLAVDALGRLIVIDDLQYAKSRPAIQELLHVLNHAADRGVQIVAAADRPPSELEGDSTRLANRFTGGLVVEMRLPGEPSRIALLQHWIKKTKIQGGALELPQETIQAIAANFAGGGRAIQGLLKRVALKYDLDKTPPHIDDVLELCADLVSPQNTRVRVEDIVRVVTKHFGVSRMDIFSSRRTANIVRPRQIAMYLAKVMTLRSLPEIGRRFGGRDHTTVLHAVRKIEGLVHGDKALANEIEVLKRMVHQ